MDVDGLKLGQGDDFGPNKESGPKSFREVKSSARGKSKDDESDGGSIKVAKGESIPPPNLKEKVVVSGPEGKENIGPKSDISLRPNYKKAKVPFKEKEISCLAGISTGPEVIVGNWRPLDDGLRRKEVCEATGSGGSDSSTKDGALSKGVFEAHAHSLGQSL